MYIYIYMYVHVCVEKNNLPLPQSSIRKTAYLEIHVKGYTKPIQLHSQLGFLFVKTGSLAQASLELLMTLRITLN